MVKPAYVLTEFVLYNAVSATFALVIGIYALFRGTQKDKSLSVMLGVMFFWCIFLAMEYAAVDVETKVLWAKLEYLGLLTIPVLFLNHALLISHHDWQFLRRHILWLFVIPVITILFTATNEYHHLIWTTFTPSPAGKNLLVYGHGILFWVLTVGYSYLIMLIAGSILFRWAVKQRKENRGTVIRIGLAGILPWLANGVYVFGFSPLEGLELATFAFVISGFLLELDLQIEERERNLMRQQDMSQSIRDLNEQIHLRQQLESDLLSSREEISARLSALNSNLISLFDMVLISNETQVGGDLISGSLVKIREILSCQALVFFKQEENTMRLTGSIGLTEDASNYLLAIRPDWHQAAPEVQMAPHPGGESSFPMIFLGDMYKAAAGKSIQIRGKVIGYICALWEEPHEFGVDEIIFINGTTDTFGLLFEYSRLNHIIADTAKMQERRRLAQDLHDSVTQSLQGLIFSAETAQVQQTTSPEKLHKTLEMISTGSRQALKEMRMLLYELRLSNPSETNLVSLIRNRVAAVEKRAGVHVSFKEDNGFFLPKNVEAEMYPFMMEALNNSLKHAHASQVSVNFEVEASGMWIRIQDDGIGFNPLDEHTGGMGLKNMRERCNRVGALYKLLSTPGKGTSVEVFLSSNLVNSL